MYKNILFYTPEDLNPHPLVWTAECNTLCSAYGSGKTYLCEIPWIMKVKFESCD
jgi:hypothetical protein